jgi:hypothetical protein
MKNHSHAIALDAVAVLAVERCDSRTICLVTSCPDCDTYQSLPAAVWYDGLVFSKTGWNSDSGRGYYQYEGWGQPRVAFAVPTERGPLTDALPPHPWADAEVLSPHWLAPEELATLRGTTPQP